MVFSWTVIGRFFFEAAVSLDFPIILTVITLIAFAVVTIQALLDMIDLLFTKDAASAVTEMHLYL